MKYELRGDEVLNELAERAKARAEYLKGLEFRHPSYEKQKLETLFGFREQILKFLEQFYGTLYVRYKKNDADLELDVSQPDVGQYLDPLLQRVEQMLDQTGFFPHKFSTMPGSGHGDKLVISKIDSIYYQTAEGITFRLRKASAYESGRLREMVQPLFEKAVFQNDNRDSSEQPQLGYRVYEASTTDFFDLQQAFRKTGRSVKYFSPLRLYYDKGKLATIDADNPQKLEIHTGDMVNKIYN